MTTFWDLPPEVIAKSLENLSFAQMYNWCKNSKRGDALCSDNTHIIGQLFEEKYRNEVIGAVNLTGGSFDEDYLSICCNLWNMQDDNPFTLEVGIIMNTYIDVAREILAFDVENDVYTLWEINMGDVDGTIIVDPDQILEVQIEMGENNVLLLGIDLLKTIFRIALKLHERGIYEDEGSVYILTNLSSVLNLNIF